MKHLITLLFLGIGTGLSGQSSTRSDSYEEIVFVHTDRGNYVTGETLWYKVYVLNGNNHTPSKLSKVAYLEILNADNEAQIQQKILLKDGVGDGSIYLPISLKTSGYKLRAYTRWMRNYPPDKYFEKLLSIINPLVKVDRQPDSRETSVGVYKKPANEGKEDPLHLAIDYQLEKENFSQRDRVNVVISSPDDQKNKSSLNLSMSVFRVDSMHKYSNPTINDYLQSGSVNRSHSFSGDFIPEYEGHLIEGSISGCTNESVKGRLVYLYNKEANTIMYSTRTDSSGNFLFVVKNFMQAPVIQVQTDKDGQCYNIVVDSPFSSEYSHESLPFYLDEKDLPEISKRSIQTQVNNAFNSGLISYDSLEYINLFDGAYKLYKLDDYVRFNSLETTVREYVSEVSVRKEKGIASLRVRNDLTHLFFDSDPLILLDGAVVSDVNSLFSINPRLIDRIQIVSDKYLMGDIVSDGVVGFFSKAGVSLTHQNENEYQLPIWSGKRTQGFEDYSIEQQYTSPKPDFRTLLYWNHSIEISGKSDTQLTFFTSDIRGKYVGIIQGISSDGRYGSTSFLIEVD